MRWIGLVVFIILLIIAWRRKDLKNYAFSLILGGLAGYVLDCIFVTLGLWEYPRQSFMSIEYFALVVTGWSIFGAAINMINDWYMKRNWLSLIIIAVVFVTGYEVINIWTESWIYYTSWLLVILGWIPLILYFRSVYLLVVRSEFRRAIIKVWSC